MRACRASAKARRRLPVKLESGVAGSASVEAEHEFVEVALEMLSSQSVIDAERPGLGVGEGAVDPGQVSASAGKYASPPGTHGTGGMARGARSTEPASDRLVGVFRLWLALAGVSGRPVTRLPTMRRASTRGRALQ